MNSLPAAAERVQAAARDLGLTIEIRTMAATTRTAEEAATACGCAVGQIVKSLVFRGAKSGKPYLLLVSGANRVNEKAVAGLIGEALRRPDADYVRSVTGFAIGGIPPLGHDTPLDTFMDEALLAFEEVWAAAGTSDAVFPVAPQRLAEATAARIIAVG
jgi:prolyl-tRNA editing enzyme YbaK/EbsC (Cys-tRNA(Pro) deacylase)